MAKTEYPGQLDDYTEARDARKAAQESLSDPLVIAALTIVELLAGISYQLDGVRYTLRKGQS